MKPVERTAQAELDVAEYWHLIAMDNPAAADRWLQKIESWMETLAEHPLVGRVREDLDPEIRSVSQYPFLILYRVLPDRVQVLRVVHGARDLRRLFEE